MNLVSSTTFLWAIGVVLALIAAIAVGLAAFDLPTRGPAPTEVIVSAAASLTDAMQDVKQAFERTHPSVHIRLNFASSGSLRHQVEKGAPVDVFISASKPHMDALVAKGLIRRSDVRLMASNALVLIRHPDAPEADGWKSLAAGAERIALGNPAHVPAGAYAKAALQSLGLWQPVQSRLVLAEDVRQVLHYVETGSASYGIVYRTDALTSEGVVVVGTAPDGSHPPIEYPLAVLADAPHLEEARLFCEFLLSDDGRQTLARHGFVEGASR